MAESGRCKRVQGGQRSLQAVVEAALAQASIALAARAARQPALAWGTSEGTHRSLSLWLATEDAPRSLPCTRALIEDGGAGARRRQTYARASMLRRLRQMGLFVHEGGRPLLPPMVAHIRREGSRHDYLCRQSRLHRDRR